MNAVNNSLATVTFGNIKARKGDATVEFRNIHATKLHGCKVRQFQAYTDGELVGTFTMPGRMTDGELVKLAMNWFPANGYVAVA